MHERARRFLASHFDPDSPGSPDAPDVAVLSRGRVAFVLMLEERWDDFVKYVQAVWDRVFNLVRGDDERLSVGSFHAISLPHDDERWEVTFTADLADEDSGAVITHKIDKWKVVETSAVF